MTLSFSKHHDSIQKAFDKVAASKNGDEWVIFDYEGNSNVIKVGDEGDYGLEEFSTSFNSGRLQYGVISVRLSPSVLPKIVLIRWQGEGVPISRLSGTTSHANDMKRYLKMIHIMIEARNEMDVEPDSIKREVAKLPSTVSSENVETSYSTPTVVGSVYKPVKPHVDINLKERDAFWEKMRSEEDRRKTEDAVHAKEKQQQYTSEREQMESNIHKKMESLNFTKPASKTPSPVVSPTPAWKAPAAPVTTPPAPKVTVPAPPSKTPSPVVSPTPAWKAPAAPATTPPAPKVTVPAPLAIPPAFSTSTPSPSTISNGNSKPISSSIAPPASPPPPVPSISTMPPPPKIDMYEVPPNEENKPEPQTTPSSEFIAPPPAPPSIKADMYELPPEEGMKAVALWDYQAADDTEISFDPDEIITEIEQIDEGWWKGRGPRGEFGLFPANYVRLL